MKKRVPQYLSKPIQFVWFEIDEVCMWFLFFLLFLLFSNWLSFLGMFICPYLFAKYKKNFPNGFLGHIFFYFGLKELKYYPISYIKTFLG